MPAAEMHETPEAIELRVEVPGMEARLCWLGQKPFLSLSSKAETKTQKGHDSFRWGVCGKSLIRHGRLSQGRQPSSRRF